MRYSSRPYKLAVFTVSKKTAMSLLVIVILFLIGNTIFGDNKKQVKKTVPTISDTKNLAQNHTLSLSALFLLDGHDPAAYYNMNQVISYIDTSYKSLQDNLTQNKTADSLNRQTLEQLLSQEPDLINQLKAEYEQLGKLLQYQPPEDIASVDSDTSKTKEQINTTVHALQTQQEQSLLTDQTKLQIDMFIACHKKTYALLEQNNISATKENSTICTKAYRKVRSNTVADLLETKNSTAINELGIKLKDLLKP